MYIVCSLRLCWPQLVILLSSGISSPDNYSLCIILSYIFSLDPPLLAWVISLRTARLPLQFSSLHFETVLTLWYILWLRNKLYIIHIQGPSSKQINCKTRIKAYGSKLSLQYQIFKRWSLLKRGVGDSIVREYKMISTSASLLTFEQAIWFWQLFAHWLFYQPIVTVWW